MQVHYDINNLPLFKNAVVTIGTFDGVHLGHQQIIAQLKNEAEVVNGETVIITFYPHPRKIISGQEIFILTTLNEKIELLSAKGIHHLVVVPFNEVFSEQSPEDYVKNFLVEKFHPHTVIIGYDHKFGKGRKGDYHLMEDYGKQFGFVVKEIAEQIINDVIISSTKIRDALLSANLDTANSYLGYDYFFEGLVVQGNKLGRTIGYPTANIGVMDTEKLIPGNGVYAVRVEIRNSKSEILNSNTESISNHQFFSTHNPQPTTNLLKGMMNIGLRPTVDGSKRVIEVNIFDFDEDIYRATIRIYLKKYLRGEVKFSGLDALKEQLEKDKEMSMDYL